MNSRHLINPKVCRQTTIVLPPLVLAEITLGAHALERLACLAQFDIRFGAEFPDFWKALGKMTDAQIASYDPIIPKGELHYHIRKSLLSVPNDFEDLAKIIKRKCQDALLRTEDFLRQARKTNHDNISRGIRIEYSKKFDTAEEALERHGLAHAGALWDLLLDHTNGNTRFECAESFWDCINWNPYIRRFLRVCDSVVLGWAGLWTQEELNVNLSPNRNDFTDILNALYLNDGDILLSADKKLKEAIDHSEKKIEPSNRVRTLCWNECIKSLVA